MFLITNREVNQADKTINALGSKPNPKGPNELRVVEAVRVGGQWGIHVLPDVCTPAMLKSVGITPDPNDPRPVYASRYVAYKTLLQLRARQKKTGKAPAVTFFVHGFNNDVEAVLDRAHTLESLYGVHVIAFTWPANGGGVSGVLSYKSDKRDALASVGALDRAIAKVNEYMQELNQPRVDDAEVHAEVKHGDDAERWDEQFTREMMRQCPFTLNLILHSMGNYLYKGFMGSSSYRGHLLVFDNVLLVAADTNNADHVEWVDRIQCRKRVYITVNENDVALRASRLKAGEEQKARLGHWPHNLDSRRAMYVDFTGASHVGDSHAYFEGTPAQRNAKVRAFFELALHGEAAERGLSFDGARNMYRVR